METINISRDDDYHSQLNNKKHPLSTCNTTSMVNALKASGIKFACPLGLQPEDHLSALLETDEARERMKRLYPWAVNAEAPIPARQIHGMLAWAVNEKLVKAPVVTFSTSVNVQEIFHNILRGIASVVTGRFTRQGHLVTVVGFITSQDSVRLSRCPTDIVTDLINGVIVDDPYGDYHSGYESPRGNDIMFDYAEFNWLTRIYIDPGRKWAHLFRRTDRATGT